jgi:hypothetical protein
MVKTTLSRMNEVMPGASLGALYWDYVLEWWPMRNATNVLLLHYADAVKDLQGTVSKLAAFVGVQLTDSEHAKIVEKCGMTHMKSVTHKFQYSLPLNPEFNAKNLGMILKDAMTQQGVLKLETVRSQPSSKPGGLRKARCTVEKMFIQRCSSGPARVAPSSNAHANERESKRGREGGRGRGREGGREGGREEGRERASES